MWQAVRAFFRWMFGLSSPRDIPLTGLTGRHKLSEIEFSKILAKVVNGETEYRLPDDSRVDILTTTHAIEVDWARKWPEGVGQALYYGVVTGRQPVVLLLTDAALESRFINRCHLVCDTYRISLWIYDWPSGKLVRDGKTTEVR